MPDTQDRKLIFDPLTEFMAHYADAKSVKKESSSYAGLSVEERLKQRIIDGDKIGLDSDLSEALKSYPALDIINTILLGGMKVVGELFGAGEMQLPFVLQSAETMKAAVKYLEPFMEKSAGDTSKGRMVLATVKGDVHDIGKNLVDIILTNNGYTVYNLGIKVGLEQMLEEFNHREADAIGMSGLLVKSTAIMKENLEVMAGRGLQMPVILGGAALTRKFVEQDLRSLYGGTLAYAQDAFDGLHFMERLKYPDAVIPGAQDNQPVSEEELLEEELDSATGEESKMVLAKLDLPWLGGASVAAAPTIAKVQERVAPLSSIPTPPFWGVELRELWILDKVWEYLNEVALFRGQWQLKRGKKTMEQHKQLIEDVARPKLSELKLLCKQQRILQPKAVYGYFPCYSEGDDVVVLKPKDVSTDDLLSKWNNELTLSNLTEYKRFSFPRQPNGKELCISDFFWSKEKVFSQDQPDVISLSAVTVGRTASEFTAKLFESNQYADYLYLHGLSVETAEALAEYLHKIVRLELGIAAGDAENIQRLFSQGYQGSRYSFGYPACPNLEDQTKLFDLLRPERIDITLTEEFHLEPEQSTTAIICHHPEARYFGIK
ncbi:MAG TPA: vitamin B12 dependent-methionine synthase activation domain-containing protein [Candidatus Kapabacteria bacterium]|nr:vitamin B12 dependent-methionine synthase activation domain-containing protein [Candidatus Kapabacteria bacterium]